MEPSDFNTWRKIAGIIVREATGELTPEEENELKTWLKNPGNDSVYKRIRNSGNYQEWSSFIESIDVKQNWESLSRTLKHQEQRKILPLILKYAAILILPIMVIGGFYLYLSKNKIEKQVVTNQSAIVPGGSRATLFLNDGNSVILDNPEKMVIREKDGTTIYKSEGLLDYSGPASREPGLKNTIDIPRGGEFKLILADRTRMTINSMSRFSYPVRFSEATRMVELTGEACFEVAHDKNKPFIVKTGGIEVEVLGTSFNINSYEGTGKIITTLAEGKVRIRYAGNTKSIDLNPDEQAIFYTGKGTLEVEKTDASLFTAWTNGKFVFRDQRLEDILITLARWYSVNVDFENPSLKEIRFSGSLDRYGDFAPILDIIGSTGEAATEINRNNILLKDKK